jgi:hypothetical protein
MNAWKVSKFVNDTGAVHLSVSVVSAEGRAFCLMKSLQMARFEAAITKFRPVNTCRDS